MLLRREKYEEGESTPDRRDSRPARFLTSIPGPCRGGLQEIKKSCVWWRQKKTSSVLQRNSLTTLMHHSKTMSSTVHFCILSRNWTQEHGPQQSSGQDVGGQLWNLLFQQQAVLWWSRHSYYLLPPTKKSSLKKSKAKTMCWRYRTQ